MSNNNNLQAKRARSQKEKAERKSESVIYRLSLNNVRDIRYHSNYLSNYLLKIL